jgi:AcrR family transcriptional regulator
MADVPASRENDVATAEAAAGAANRTGPRPPKGARTRARLLEAAKQIFEEYGFLDARVSDIAERAGLSHGSFYHYFESKEQIFREIAELMDERLSEPLATVILAPDAPGTRRERLREAIRRHLESYRDEARIMGVIEQVSRYDEHVGKVRAARHRTHREEIADSIRRMQRRGMADPSLDPLIVSAALGSMMSRFAELWLVQQELDCSLDDAVEQLTAVFVNALGMKEDAEAGHPRPPRATGR